MVVDFGCACVRVCNFLFFFATQTTFHKWTVISYGLNYKITCTQRSLLNVEIENVTHLVVLHGLVLNPSTPRVK